MYECVTICPMNPFTVYFHLCKFNSVSLYRVLTLHDLVIESLTVQLMYFAIALLTNHDFKRNYQSNKAHPTLISLHMACI